MLLWAHARRCYGISLDEYLRSVIDLHEGEVRKDFLKTNYQRSSGDQSNISLSASINKQIFRAPFARRA